MGVVDGELLLAFFEVVQRDAFFLRVFGLDHSMAVAEGAALHILTADPDRMPLHEQRPVGEQFSEAPV